MAGRHSATPPRRWTAALVIGLVAAVVVTVGGWTGYRALAGNSCGQYVHLSITAATEIAPAVRTTTDEWLATNPKVGGACVALDVVAAEPVDTAAAIAGRHQATLPGVGQADGAVGVPDVWIPDSSIWLQRLRSAQSAAAAGTNQPGAGPAGSAGDTGATSPAGPGWVPDDAPSIASSPVVLAMPEPVASRLGWPQTPLTWGTLVPQAMSGGLRAGIVEPDRDAAGLSGLIGMLGAANPTDAAGQQAAIKMLRTFAVGRSLVRDDLLAHFPRAASEAAIAAGVAVAPMSEQSVIAYNRGQPPVPLAAVSVQPAAPALDYPFALLPGASAQQGNVAQAVLKLLAGEVHTNRLAHVGLRAADGSVGAGFPTLNPAAGAGPGGPSDATTPGATGTAAGPTGEPATGRPTEEGTPSAPPTFDPAAIDKTLSTWRVVTSPGRLLAVIDVSGSMLEPVPTAGGATREQVTTEAARRGLALLDDAWVAGLWIFSTQLDWAKDYRQLLPLAPLSSQRGEMLGQLAAIRPKPDGATGLYDTTLAAYKAVQDGWDPSRVNSLVIMTDGRNDDPQGQSLDELVAALTAVRDPARPIQVIAIGIGDQVNEAELRRITATTGGGTFIAPDPSRIGEIFLQALALRTGIKR